MDRPVMGAGEQMQAMLGAVQAGHVRNVRHPCCLRLGDLTRRNVGRVYHYQAAESGRAAGSQRASQRVQRLDLDRHIPPSFKQLLSLTPSLVPLLL